MVEIILAVIIGNFLYSIVLKAIGITIINNLFSKEEKKSFKDKIEERMKNK